MEIRLLVVPDVNVLVSGATATHFAPAVVVETWKDQIINFATSELILNDLQRVFTYPKIVKLSGMHEAQAAEYVDTIREGSWVVSGTTGVKVSPDPDDDKLFACADESEADYIVSMDRKHVLSVPEYHGTKTIHPTDFVNNILQREKAA